MKSIAQSVSERYDIVHRLVTLIFIQNWNQETALFGACRGGHVEVARILLDQGASYVTTYTHKVESLSFSIAN